MPPTKPATPRTATSPMPAWAWPTTAPPLPAPSAASRPSSNSSLKTRPRCTASLISRRRAATKKLLKTLPLQVYPIPKPTVPRYVLFPGHAEAGRTSVRSAFACVVGHRTEVRSASVVPEVGCTEVRLASAIAEANRTSVRGAFGRCARYAYLGTVYSCGRASAIFPTQTTLLLNPAWQRRWMLETGQKPGEGTRVIRALCAGK